MRTAHWTLLLSTLMFVTGVWFAVVGARPATAEPAGPIIEPVATVKQLMDAVVTPASAAVYQSVSIILDEKGVHENYPRTEREWELVAANAAALVEAGGLLMAQGRARDQEAWQKISREMIDASTVSLNAAQAQDKDALLASGEALNASCDNCHRTYNVDE
jgi:hypothetical protein